MKDFLVIGAGSAGCVLAAELTRRGAGSVAVLEAGRSERHPLVSMPFGLVWLMGGKRDWQYRSAPLAHSDNREINIPRGKMVGGSGSINSMVWFRGRSSDFDGWDISGWSYADVEQAFEAVEARLKPKRMEGAHSLTEGLAAMLGSQGHAVPTPEYESAGVFAHNMMNMRRHSAADGFLRPSGVEVVTNVHVDRLLWDGDHAVGVMLLDGTKIAARKGVVLCAGSLATPAILMRSGIGPQDDLNAHDIDTRVDAPEIGQNLHDHPGVGLHFEGAATGYGLEASQWLSWAAAPSRYYAGKGGRLASPMCEGGAFFNARGTGAMPDVQSHFIPFHLDSRGKRYALKSGYFADVCLCRPKSRGQLRLTSKDANAPPSVDLGLLTDPRDLETLVAGLTRLRALLALADFGTRRGREVHPGVDITGDALRDYVRRNVGTAYHPVGTVRLGGPISNRLAVHGTRGLWVADASVMPQVTSANTNAPSMMIGWKGAKYISEDAA